MEVAHLPRASSPRDDMQRERAAALLQMTLDRRHLPGFVPGEPSGLAGMVAASDLAPRFLEELARVYAVRRWSREAFLRAYAGGALEGWRPGQRVAVAPGEIRITASSCPLAAEAEIDPRTCQMCRAFQREVALRAVPEAIDVWFDETITHGDAACAMTIRVRDRKGASS